MYRVLPKSIGGVGVGNRVPGASYPKGPDALGVAGAATAKGTMRRKTKRELSGSSAGKHGYLLLESYEY